MLKFFNKKLILFVFLFSFCFCLTFISAPITAQAEPPTKEQPTNTSFIDSWIYSAVSAGLEFILGIVGVILTILSKALVKILNFNTFVSQQAVEDGWNIVLTLCNMFFIIILLAISFATVLRIESYGAKQLLGKLLIAAVLINFSKTICGVIIEVSQVLMQSFAKGINEGGIASLLGANQWLSFDSNSVEHQQAITQTNGLLSIALGIIFAIIASTVILLLIAVLLTRIIMLWIYIVLSPFAFLLSTFPAGQQYASKWWSQFTQQVVTGPILAFFIWLAFSIKATPMMESGAVGNCSTLVSTKIMCLDNFLNFAVSVTFLIGGIIVTQQMGGAAGAIAGKAMGAIKGTAHKLSGARYVQERYQAFQGHRESERKAKVQESGEKLFSTYKGVTAAPGAILKGLEDASVGRATRAFKGTQAGRATAAATEAFRSRRNTKREDKKKREENYDNGQYQKKVDGQMKTFTRGEEGFNEDEFHELTLNRSQGSMRDAWTKGMTQSRAIQNKTNEQATTQQQQEFRAAGLTPTQLKTILLDTGATTAEKMAAAMTLAEEGTLNSHEQVTTARETFSSDTQQLNKFNEAVNKKQAHLSQDLSRNSNNTGFEHPDQVANLTAKIDDGTIDLKNLSIDQINDENFMQVIQEHLGASYKDTIESNYKGKSTNKKNAVKERLSKQINRENLTDDEGNLIDNNAKILANLTGDYALSFKDSNGSTNHDALGSYIKDASANELANMSNNMFNEENTEIAKTIGKNLTHNQLKSISKNDGIGAAIKVNILSSAVIHANNETQGQINGDPTLRSASISSEATDARAQRNEYT